VLQHRIENLACLLGAASGRQSQEPLKVADRPRTCLRLPLRGALEVRIFSARCFGVYE